MKITIKDLSSHTVQKLVISSLEQALYQAIVIIDREEHVVWSESGKTLTTRNLIKMRELFEGVDVPEIVLRQESTYDEMIGLERNASGNRLEVPLGKNLYPLANSND